MASSSARQQTEQTVQQLAARLQVKYVAPEELHGQVEITEDLLTFDEVAQTHVLPIKNGSYKLVFGFSDATKQTLLPEIKKKFAGRNVEFVMLSEPTFSEIYSEFKRVFRPVADPLADLNQPFDAIPPKVLLDFLILKAHAAHASDIHIEPDRDRTRVRFRVDGRLNPVGELNDLAYRSVLGDIKSKGNINPYAEGGQTGHLNLGVKKDGSDEVQPLNIRVEIIPTLHGNDIVLRLFTIEEAYLNLKNLGLSDSHQANINELVERPQGLMLVVGPTGSGKTSTLYALVNEFDKEQEKIITLEDPVEYELKGVTQIPIDTTAGESFALRLRSILREDPDVVLVGEIRDPDTAATALQASLTGHLVLSTFHAQNAAAALVRLSDLIGKNSMLASAIRMAMSQRLVRLLCETCRVLHELTEQERQDLIKDLPAGNEESISTIQTAQFYKPNPEGCASCHQTGYRGRIMIVEQLVVKENIERMLVQSDLTAQALQRNAVEENGMRTMVHDGILKAAQGLTSLEEVYRVVGA